MSKTVILALDKSVRSKDAYGRLSVSVSPISKACVSPYLGSEIPNGDLLGLQMDRAYYLLRDPVELAKAADSFRGMPILMLHKPTSAEDHPRELTVGAVGTDVAFNAPYLEASLTFWTEDAIAGIETKVQTEISSGYGYRADMTPGTYEGVAYDGVMRDIIGNHIALVDVGRAGPDVVVADQKPIILRNITMATKKIKLSRTAMAVSGALRAYLTPKLAQDAAIGSLGSLLVDVKAATFAKQRPALVAAVKKHMEGKLAADAKLDDIDKAMDAMQDDDIAEDEDDDLTDEEKAAKAKAKAGATDEDPDDKPKDKPAMDAATVTGMIKDAVAANTREMNALHQARKDVLPMVGECALDSAEAVYRFALDKAGIDNKDVHASALRALVTMAQDRKAAAPVIGMDIAVVKATTTMFPGLARFTHA